MIAVRLVLGISLVYLPHVGDSAIAVIKTKLYIFGGTNTAGAMSSTVYTYDITPDGELVNGASGADLPVANANMGVFVTKGKVYLLGGGDGTTIFDTIRGATINADGSVGTWSAAGNLPMAAKKPVILASGTKLMMLGGLNAAGNIFNTAVYSKTITGGMNDYSNYYKNMSGGGDTTVTPVVETPAIGLPGAGATVADRPIVTSTPFATSAGTDYHASSIWQVSTDSNFNTITYTSPVTSGAERTSFQLPTMSNGNYWVRVKYTGGSAVESSWSAGRNFTIAAATATISAPTINTPSSGASVPSGSVTIMSSSFVPSTGSITHTSTDIQFATDSGFTTGLVSRSNTGADKTQYIETGLTAGTSYYVRVRYNGSGSIVSAWSAGRNFTTQAAVVATIAKPSITYPTANMVLNQDVLGIMSSSFTPSPSGSLTHQRSLVQVSTSSSFTAGAFVHDIINTGPELDGKAVVMPVTAGPFYTRVKYISSTGVESPWSDTVTFTRQMAATVVNINKPTFLTPTNGQTNVPFTSGITAGLNNFSLASGSAADTHASTDWQLAKNSSFSPIEQQAMNSSDKTVHRFDSLTGSTSYFFRVRHNGATGAQSPWSDTVQITTAAPVVVATTLGTPAVSMPSTVANNVNFTATSTAYSLLTGTSPHAKTSWYVYSDSACTILYTSESESTVNLTSKVFNITTSTTKPFYVKCKHHAADGTVSTLSSAASINVTVPVVVATIVKKPVITVPAVVNNTTAFNITSSAYQTTQGVGTHKKTIWYIHAGGTLVQSIDSSSTGPTNLTYWSTSVSVAQGSSYTVKCIHVSTDDAFAESDPVAFTIAAVGPTNAEVINTWNTYESGSDDVPGTTTVFEDKVAFENKITTWSSQDASKWSTTNATLTNNTLSTITGKSVDHIKTYRRLGKADRDSIVSTWGTYGAGMPANLIWWRSINYAVADALNPQSRFLNDTELSVLAGIPLSNTISSQFTSGEITGLGAYNVLSEPDSLTARLRYKQYMITPEQHASINTSVAVTTILGKLYPDSLKNQCRTLFDTAYGNPISANTNVFRTFMFDNYLFPNDLISYFGYGSYTLPNIYRAMYSSGDNEPAVMAYYDTIVARTLNPSLVIELKNAKITREDIAYLFYKNKGTSSKIFNLFHLVQYLYTDATKNALLAAADAFQANYTAAGRNTYKAVLNTYGATAVDVAMIRLEKHLLGQYTTSQLVYTDLNLSMQAEFDQLRPSGW
jgi:hypothetical protein